MSKKLIDTLKRIYRTDTLDIKTLHSFYTKIECINSDCFFEPLLHERLRVGIVGIFRREVGVFIRCYNVCDLFCLLAVLFLRRGNHVMLKDEEIKERVKEQIEDEIQDEKEEKLKDEIKEKIKDETKDGINDEIEEKINDEINDEITEKIKDGKNEKNEKLKDKIKEKIENQIKDKVEENIKDKIKEEEKNDGDMKVDMNDGNILQPNYNFKKYKNDGHNKELKNTQINTTTPPSPANQFKLAYDNHDLKIIEMRIKKLISKKDKYKRIKRLLRKANQKLKKINNFDHEVVLKLENEICELKSRVEELEVLRYFYENNVDN